MRLTTLLSRSFLLLFLFLSASPVTAAEKRELSTDAQLHAQARQLAGRDPASVRALFGLSQREDLKEVRSLIDRNGVTRTRYRQTLEGVDDRHY